MTKLKRTCPICNNANGEVLHMQSFLLDDNNPLPSSYDVVSCTQCSFVYADVDASQEDYNKYYENFSKYESTEVSSGGGTTPGDKQRLSDTADDIMMHIANKEAKILDIGAAMGGLLINLKQNNYNNLYALEPSKTCVTYMKNEYKLNAYQGSILDDFDEIFNGKKFDFIILSHVFEHIYDLKKTIINIRSLLSDTGKIYIEVPDASGYNDCYVVPYYYFDMEHINHFDQHSLQLLMGTHGFRAIASGQKNITASESVMYPAVWTLFEINTISKNAILKYIEKSKLNDHNEVLSDIITSGKECVVWGAGSFTKRLLAQSDLRECNIQFFIDKDENKQEKYIDDIIIKSPDALKNFRGTIIVASALFASEIVREIKNDQYDNEIIILG